MMARRLNVFFRRAGGVFLAVGGILLIVKTMPLYLWPLALGCICVWLGWQLYIYDRLW
jgi:hypothetical protein